MVSPGAKVQVEHHTYQVVRSIGAGGEGNTYEVTDLDTGHRLLLKQFHSRQDPQVLVRRTEYLVSRHLDRHCHLITAPQVVIRPKGLRTWCGYLAQYRQGQPLDELLYVPEVNLLANLQLAIAIVHPLRLLHQAGISHGDIHPRNVIVRRNGEVLVPYWIDLDNFSADGVESSRAWGALEYLAPEVRSAMAQGKPFPPDIKADRFSAACLLHEMLFVRHPAAGHDGDPESFDRAMRSGVWLHDPARGRIDHNKVGGLSNLIVNAEIAKLFRRSFGVDRDRRPTMEEWQTALLKNVDNVYLCPHCGYPNLIDASKQLCPSCNQPYPILSVQLPNGSKIVIDQATVLMGRRELRSPHVSDKHAVLRRIGPETWIEPLGRNGTYRWVDGGDWVRMPNGKAHLLQVDDRLRFADVAARICA